MSSSSNRYAVLGEASSSSKEQQQDTAQPGPPAQGEGLSMGSLESTLPHVLSREEGLAEYRKRRLAWKEEQAQEDERKKRRQATSSTLVPRLIPSAAPEPDDGMEVEKEFNCRKIINPDRRTRCVFRYEDAKGDFTDPLGSLWDIEKGWSAHVQVEAGRFGSARVSLSVRINKGDKTAPLSRNPDDYFKLDVTWRAGIAVDGQPVIETLQVTPVMNGFEGQTPYHSGIVGSCPEEQLHKLDRLVSITFKCNSAKVSQIEEAWLEGLDDHVQDSLKKLLLGLGPHTMTIWFLVYPNVDTARKNWANALEDSVSSGFSAFWQYRTVLGEPNFSIDDTEVIRTFNKEMYVDYRSQRNPDGSEKRLEDGRVVEDKTQVRGYHNFERQLSWEVPFEFAVFNIVPIIRGVQFEKCQVAHLGLGTHLVHFEGLPKVPVTGSKGFYVMKQPKGGVRGFVRQATNGPVPTPGARIRAELDNSNPRTGKPHMPSKDKRTIWWGTVLKNMQIPCKDTGTDFCVWFQMPLVGTTPRIHETAKEKLDNHKLVRMHIEVVIDETSAQREINGMQKLADETFNAAMLAPVRIALMSNPSKMTHTTSDLTEINPEMWREWEAYCSRKYADNPAQLEIVTSLKEVKNKMTAVIGPPGTGKTTVLADITNGAVLCGHTVLVCAVSNNAIDKAANSCWDNFPAAERKRYKFLRYETASAEMQAYLTRKDILNPESQDPNARPVYKDAPTMYDDAVIAQTMSEAAASQGERDRQLYDLFKLHGSFSKALSEKQAIDERKRSNVPAPMTLPNRISELTMEDEYLAHGENKAELKAHRADKLDAAAIGELRRSGEYRSEAELAALGEDALDEAEITARLNDGRIPSIQQRDKSAAYRRSLRDYVAANGKVSKEARQHFETLRTRLVLRVFAATNALFTTCNNAGSELMVLGFNPTLIEIDESGQLTVAALANVLTSFHRWLAVIIFGDPAQLKPFFLSGRANEFRENAMLSVLALLEEKDYPILRLVFQYRMAPAISRWVSEFFYKGLLKNHPSALTDNSYREVARAISKIYYGREGPNGDGSEYWMINIANGVSRVQVNSTSLQNYASADRIATLVDQTLSTGVPPSKVTVLVYYTGQLSLVGHKIKETARANGRNWEFSPGYQVSLVDSFQGEENEFVFVDFVTAHQSTKKKDATVEAEGSEDDESVGWATAHVKSANRLCCALTRGRSCVVVVCQLNALLRKVRPAQRRAQAAISAMARDFLERDLVYNDYTSLDTSPIGQALRATWTEARLAVELKRQKAESLDFLNTQYEKVKKARYNEEFQDTAPRVYRTTSRRTTRPNLSGDAAEAADRHDLQDPKQRSALVTEAGAVPVNVAGQSQRTAKVEKKAAKDAARKKAAEEAAGEAQAVKPKWKGKGKETEEAMDVAKEGVPLVMDES